MYKGIYIYLCICIFCMQYIYDISYKISRRKIILHKSANYWTSSHLWRDSLHKVGAIFGGLFHSPFQTQFQKWKWFKQQTHKWLNITMKSNTKLSQGKTNKPQEIWHQKMSSPLETLLQNTIVPFPSQDRRLTIRVFPWTSSGKTAKKSPFKSSKSSIPNNRDFHLLSGRQALNPKESLVRSPSSLGCRFQWLHLRHSSGGATWVLEVAWARVSKRDGFYICFIEMWNSM